MTRHAPLSIVDSLRLGAGLPGCLNKLTQLEAADTIERQEKTIDEIMGMVVALEKRVRKLER